MKRIVGTSDAAKRLDIYRGRIFSPVSGGNLRPERVTNHVHFDDGLLAVNRATGLIEEVSDWKDSQFRKAATSGKRGARFFDVRPHWIFPGFVDTHVHLPQLGVAGRSGLELLDWLDRYIFPAEMQFADRKFAIKASRRFFGELAACGTTTAVVMAPMFEMATHFAFEEARRANLRVFMGNVLMDQNGKSVYQQTTDEAIESSVRLCKTWNGSNNGLLHYLFTPRFAITCSRSLMERVGEEAKRLHAGVHTHLNENRGEIAAVKAKHPWARNYTEVYRQCGLLSPDRLTVLAHQVHPSIEELHLLDPHQVCIAHCPSSNFALHSGAFEFWQVYGNGQRQIGLGSDVGAGPNLTMWDAMRHAGHLTPHPRALNVFQLFHLATLSGAQALRLPTGSLEAKKEADFMVVDPSSIDPGHPDRRACGLEETLLMLMNRVNDSSQVVQKTVVRGRVVFSRKND